MKKSTVLITGADANYFWLLSGALGSISQFRNHLLIDVVVLDFGLTGDQKAMINDEYGASVIRPGWTVNVPEKFKTPRNLAFGTRCTLPAAVPGYDIYIWMDCDAWVQQSDFFEAYMRAAQRGELAIVAERESAYSTNFALMRWNMGNQLLAFGLIDGLKVFVSPPINSGVFAARGDHELWNVWKSRFESAVLRSGKIIMDQHSLKAAIALDKIPVAYLESRFNWICSRAKPVFDTQTKLFCLPYEPFLPVTVMHLAGTSKSTDYELTCLDGLQTRRSVLFQQQ